MDTGNLIPIILFLVIGWVIKMLSDNHIRRLLIEKGEINENLKYLYADKTALVVPSSLKWGMVLIAVGLALFLAEVLPINRHDESVLFGLMFIFGGAALIGYYIIGNRMLKKAKENDRM